MARSSLWIILAGALALRIAAVPAVHSVQYTSDEREYLHMARQLLDQGVFRDSNGDRAVRAPLYPFFLAALLTIAGNSTFLAHAVGCILGTAAVGAVYLLSLKITGDRKGALFAAGIASLYPGLVIYSALLQTESIYILIFLAAFLLLEAVLDAPRMLPSAGLGFCCGLAALTRPVFAGFIPVLVILIVWRHRGHWRSVLTPVAVTLVVAALTISPWTLRNWSLLHAFVPIASGGGSSLLTGNNPYATGTFSVREGFDEWFKSQAQTYGVADPAALDEVARSRVAATVALAYVTQNPGATLAIAAKKSFIFWIYPITHSDSFVPLQALTVGFDALFLGAVVLGIAGSRNFRHRLGPLLAAVVVFWVIQAILHSEARFRLALIPLMAVLGGAGVALAFDRESIRLLLGTPGPRRLIIGGLALVAITYGATGIMFLRGAF